MMAVEQPTNRINGAFQELTVEMQHKILLEFYQRLLKLIENDGAHVIYHVIYCMKYDENLTPPTLKKGRLMYLSKD
uniref:Uncharacterized protein n=1 Tax=Romanomermis culicivorax TaxID=13658 RepID=A0A915KJ59_ROMCU